MAPRALRHSPALQRDQRHRHPGEPAQGLASRVHPRWPHPAGPHLVLHGLQARTGGPDDQQRAGAPRDTRQHVLRKVSAQLSDNHRFAATLQYDPTTQANDLVRSVHELRRRAACSPEAFGDPGAGRAVRRRQLHLGRQLDAAVSSFVANYMSKSSDTEPSNGMGVTRIIQSNPAGNIAGSLSTIGQEGSYGVKETSTRKLLLPLSVVQLHGGQVGHARVSRRAGSSTPSSATAPRVTGRGGVLLPPARHDRQALTSSSNA